MEERPEPIGPGRAVPMAIRFCIGIGVVVAGVFVYLIAGGGQTETQIEEESGYAGSAHPAVGTMLPDLEFAALTGGDDAIDSSAWEGKVVLMNFWGPWCMPCHLEMPALAELEEKYRDSNFLFVSISCSRSREHIQNLTADTMKLMSKEEYSFRTYHDAPGTGRRRLNQAARLGGIKYPTTLIVDKRGAIGGVWLGYDRGFAKQMDQRIEALLAQ